MIIVTLKIDCKPERVKVDGRRDKGSLMSDGLLDGGYARDSECKKK